MLTEFQIQAATYVGYLICAGLAASVLFLFGNVLIYFLRKAFALVVVLVLLAALFSAAPQAVAFTQTVKVAQ